MSYLLSAVLTSRCSQVLHTTPIPSDRGSTLPVRYMPCLYFHDFLSTFYLFLLLLNIKGCWHKIINKDGDSLEENVKNLLVVVTAFTNLLFSRLW